MKPAVRRALVTGSTVRTGLHLAGALAAAGVSVCRHARAPDSPGAAAPGGPVVFGDVTDPGDCERMAAEAAALLGGPIDCLVNNVGVYHPQDLDALDPGQWRWTIAGNLDASFYMFWACKAQLLSHPRSRLVNLGFVTCDQLRPAAHAADYQVAKTGLFLLTRSIALRYAASGLTANLVSPGQLDNSIDLPPAAALPLGRPGRPGEVAAAVAYLLSDAADYVTGCNIPVSGGWQPA